MPKSRHVRLCPTSSTTAQALAQPSALELTGRSVRARDRVSASAWCGPRRVLGQELGRSVQIPTDLLTPTMTRGPNDQRGTWVHPQVAVNLAQRTDEGGRPGGRLSDSPGKEAP
jgi:hypothetical protein